MGRYQAVIYHLENGQYIAYGATDDGDSYTVTYNGRPLKILKSSMDKENGEWFSATDVTGW